VLHVTLEAGYSLATLLVVAVGAVLLAGYFYRRAYYQVAPGRWRLLFALRTLAILLVVLLLFRPVFSYEKEELKRKSVLFLVDASASMSTTDGPGGSMRFDLARNRVLDWWGKLEKDFDLHLLAFSDHAAPLDRPGDLARLQPTGEATSLTRALTAAGARVPKGDVEAVILLSDGIHNTGGDPVLVARKNGVVVHTVGVGNSLRGNSSYRDIQVTGIECPDQLPVNNKARLKAFIDAIGYPGRVTTVFLDEDGKPIGEAQLVLDDMEGPQEVAFDFVPAVKGRHTYTVRVPVAPGEKIVQNNQRSTIVQVVDARVRVLYLEGTLRAEYGALVDRFLSKDPDVEFCALVQTRPNVFARRTNIENLKLAALPNDPADFDRFDVFLLGDLDSSYWKPEQMALLAKRIRAGAGVLMFGGYHSLGAGGYGGTELEAILPVGLGGRDIGQMTESFLPVLTPEGRRHAIFANIAKFFPSSAGLPEIVGLPPLEGCARVLAPKPGAVVLATYPTGAPMPVLAVHPVGKGRAMVFTGDTTRTWQQTPRALDQESPFLRFWGQTVRWLANRTDEVKTGPGVVARTDRVYYEPESSVGIEAVVHDKDGEGTNWARVTARVKPPFGQVETVALAPVAGPGGHYHGGFEPTRTGNYEIEVEAVLGGSELRSEKLVVPVGRPNLEFDRLDLDEKMLTKLASATGGRYFHVSTADRLIEELDHKERQRHVAVEQPLYWPPLYWSLFVGALAAEWLLRKRGQLR
jgi:uncharacterized membrane protein